MSVDEENLKAELAGGKGATHKVIDGVRALLGSIKQFIKEGNTLSIQGEQLALAPAESYAKTRSRIKTNTLMSFEYIIMNALATVIVCCGLATNSILAIFGASAMAMMLDPIMGMALAIVEGDKKFFVQSAFSIIVGAGIVLAVSFVFAIVYRYHITNLPESNLMKYALPDLLDLIMAVACGAACAYATLSRKIRVGLSGIMLSITLMPPLAACGIFLAHGSISLAAGSMVSYLTNFIAIQFIASVVFWLHGFMSVADAGEEKMDVSIIFKKSKISIVCISLLAVILSMNLKSILDNMRFEQDVKTAMRSGLAKYPGVDLADLNINQENIITAVVRSSHDITREQVKRIAAGLPKKHGKQQELHIRMVKVHEL